MKKTGVPMDPADIEHKYSVGVVRGVPILSTKPQDRKENTERKQSTGVQKLKL